MRKTLLSCVVASAMALACTATSFAAVTYGEDNQLNVAYTADGNKLAVKSGWNADDAQVTLLVVKGNKPSTIQDGDILYIDQQAQADAEKAFATVGLLGETALAEGTYTVKAGGSAGNVYVSTFTVKADEPEQPALTPVTFTWCDLDADGAADIVDAGLILSSKLSDGSTKPTGSPFEIGALVNDLKNEDGSDAVDFYWCDLNADSTADIVDAGLILSSKLSDGKTKPDGSPFEIGASVTLYK